MTVKDVIELSIKVIALCVGLFGVIAYFLDRQSERTISKRASSMDLLSVFYDPDITSHRETVVRFWLENRDLFQAIESTNLSDREVEAVYLSAFTGEAGENMQSAIFRLAEFYDRVGFCSKAEICALEENRNAFCPDATLFFGAYGRYLGQIGKRSGYPSLGQNLSWFVGEC